MFIFITVYRKKPKKARRSVVENFGKVFPRDVFFERLI